MENVADPKKPRVTRMLKNWVDNTKQATADPKTVDNYRKGVGDFARIDEKKIKDEKYKKGMQEIFE